MTTIPHNSAAEWTIAATMLSKPKAVGEIIGAQVEADDFHRLDCRLVFEGAVEAYYSDSTVNSVVVAERKRIPLAHALGVPESEVATKLYEMAMGYRFSDGDLTSHIEVVKRHGVMRRLQALAQATLRAVQEGDLTPEEIGDRLTTEAANITAGGHARSEIMDWMDVGREYVRYLKRLRLAREQGVELAAYFGLKFVDEWIRGLAPTELMFVAGPPGVGKSAITWEMSQGFARRQMLKQPDQRVAAMVFSMEMGLVGSSARVAQRLTGLEGERLREGDLTNENMAQLIREWKNREGLPIYWNFASNFRMSQLRALTVEAIRRHNVGLVIIDHFRQLDPDRRINNPNQEDEAKARFLKEAIAKDLDVAVVCLAHTIKTPREGDPRPRLADLRGSGQVAAHADIVAMMHRPWMYASENEKAEMTVRPEAAEMIYTKNRNGALGTADFEFRPATMAVRDVN